MSVAAQACAVGGSILLVAECREGVGGPEYAEMMGSESSPGALLARFGADDHQTVFDQWQLQVQAMVQAKHDVWLHSSLDEATTAAAHLRYAPDVDATLMRIIDEQRATLGREPTLCVMPYGQLTVPRVTAA
jgi:nickel-dependent lactate racemase